jgi:hypothetical protein
LEEGIKKVNDKISDRMKHIMKISNTNVNIYEKMFTLMCDIFIMCFVLSEIFSLVEEKEYSRSLFPSVVAAAAAAGDFFH